MARRPLIGVTTSAKGGWRAYLFSRLSLMLAGGRARRLRPDRERPTHDLDGLIIGGGDDIGTEHYGGESLPDIRIDPERDRLELILLGEAERRRLPVLGICRGAQMLNIHRGGSLHTDIHEIYDRVPKGRTILPLRHITIAAESRLALLMQQESCRANVLHHQSIWHLGEGLNAVAHDRYGIIQGIEAQEERFLFGVQWHPELLFYHRRHRRLFHGLVAAARRRLESI